jgi:hypothetical protein
MCSVMCSNRIHLAIDRPKVHSCTDFPLEEATTACFSATLVVRGRSQDMCTNTIERSALDPVLAHVELVFVTPSWRDGASQANLDLAAIC